MKKYQLFADIFLYIFLMILYNILEKVIILNKIRNTLSTLNIIFTICSIFVIIFEIVKIDKFMPIIINKEEITYILLLLLTLIIVIVITAPIIISSFILYLKDKEDKLLLNTMCINLFFKVSAFLLSIYIKVYITGPSV